jgi:hypothetical protein
MKLNNVTEVVWRWYQDGNASTKKQTLRQPDIEQAVTMGYANVMRDIFYASKKGRESGGDEYYFYSGDLTIREFDLTEADIQGMRRALIPDEVARLPRNADITNVYPIGTCNGLNGEITQVQPGEENFYLSADFKDFLFFVQKGRGVNTYHLPPCVKKIAVERIYITADMEISIDVAFDIMKVVIQLLFGVKGTWDKDQIELRKRLEQQEGISHA